MVAVNGAACAALRSPNGKRLLADGEGAATALQQPRDASARLSRKNGTQTLDGNGGLALLLLFHQVLRHSGAAAPSSLDPGTQTPVPAQIQAGIG